MGDITRKELTLAKDGNDGARMGMEAKLRRSLLKTMSRWARRILPPAGTPMLEGGGTPNEPTSPNAAKISDKIEPISNFLIPEIDMGKSLSRLMGETAVVKALFENPAHPTSRAGETLVQGLKPADTTKPLPEKPLPALPREDRVSKRFTDKDLQRSPLEALEQGAQEAFDRILARQQKAMDQASARLGQLDKPARKPAGDTRSLRSQQGDVWGSVAPRTPSPEGRDRLHGAAGEPPEPVETTSVASTVKVVRAQIIDIPKKPASLKAPPSAEHKPLSRSTSASTTGSQLSIDSRSSAVGDSSIGSPDTSKNTQAHVEPKPIQPDPGKETRTRPPAEELYEKRLQGLTRG